MAILALVFAFVFAPAGIVLGIVARKQIRQTGEEGDGLALAGIIVGGIATAFFVADDRLLHRRVRRRATSRTGP